MALARLKSIEALRYYAPGEWGKLLGIDRAPEVRTLRVKLKHLADQDQAFSWSAELCKEWMMAGPDEASVLYVDGHVRVYHGNTKQLPKHYVARERLCLSATADYWVNAMDGKPFFVVSQAVDPGMLQVLERDIVPRLEQDVPNQPSAEQLDADRLLHRFTVVFDREGYSPNFFAKMKERRIACLTYHKHPGEDWAKEEFLPTEVRLASGARTTMQLAERGTQLSNRLWVREFRKLSDSAHQTALLSTDYHGSVALLAPALFSRWSQENFFRYMRQSYNLDGLVDYRTERIPDTVMVVNLTVSQIASHVWWSFARAAWAARQDSRERDDQYLMDGGDRVGDVALRSYRRRRGVGNLREWQVSRTSWSNEVLRGESSPVRRSGIHRPRCTARRDGGSPASRDPRSGRGRSPARVPGNRARCANACWRCRRVRGRSSSWRGSKANTWGARPRLSATRSAASLPGVRGRPCPARWAT